MHNAKTSSLICVLFVPTTLHKYSSGIHPVSCYLGVQFTISLVKTKKVRISEAICLKIYYCAKHSKRESDHFILITFYRYGSGVGLVLCHSRGRFTVSTVKTKKLMNREATCLKIHFFA